MKRLAAALLVATLFSGCALAPAEEAASTFTLHAAPVLRRPAEAGPVLALGVPRSGAGFETARIAYTRRASEVEYFARSAWVAPPAEMIAQSLAGTLERSGSFRAVVRGADANAELRLDLELVRLLQDFQTRPSRVILAVRVRLVAAGTRRVLAAAELAEEEPASSEDAYGGVLAANRALGRLLERIGGFAVEGSGKR